jgi:uncharacterized delta-60 repeat protein
LREAASDVALARYGPDGSLDNSFNGTGKLMIDIKGNDGARAVEIQPDGKILLFCQTGMGTQSSSDTAGVAFARLMPDGDRDKAFYHDGKLAIQFQTRNEAFGMVMSSDYVVSVGSAGDNDYSDFALARIRF